MAISAEDRVGFVAALIDAWAAVGDNLTFYQERIANEGFLRTAREDFSLRALLGAVGYRPRPSVSATTFLNFKLLEGKGAPERVIIDRGVAVQSVPAPGQTSVVFETDESIEARPEWNVIRPSLPKPPPRPVIEPGVTTQLRVKGAAGFQAGMLLIARPVGGAATPQARILTKVEPDPTAARTLLSWRPPFDADPDLKKAWEIYVCTQQAALFGVSAPVWASQPDEVKARYGHRIGVTRKSGDSGANWAPVEAGLPASGVGAFAFGPDGALLAALEDSVFVNATNTGWTRKGTPIVRHNILVLTTSPNGQLYASTQNGEVLCSNDGGANWFALVGPQGRLPPKDRSARLPAVPVGALSVLALPGKPSLVIAGTASGVWTAPAHGGDWTPWNNGFLGYDSKTPSASVDVRALMCNPSTGVYLAATDNGIYRASEVQARWRPLSPRVAKNAKTPLDARSLAVDSGGVIFASVSGQLLISLDNGESWTVNPAPAPDGLGPLACAGAILFAGCAAGLFVSTDRGTTWSPSGQSAGRPIAALAAGANQVAFAETFGGYSDSEWPGLVIDAAPSGQDLYLDRAYPSLAPGDFMGLVDMDPATGQPATRVLSIVSVATQTRQAFTQTARVTRIGLARLQGPINPRSVQCHILARRLDPIPEAEEQPAAATLADARGGTCDLALEGSLTGLDGRRVSLAGRRARLRIDEPAGGVRHWNAAAANWSPTGTGNHNVNAMLLSSANELLLAGQVDVRVFRNGHWAVFGGESLGREAFCLAEIGSGTFLAGSADGIWRCLNAQSWERMALPGQRINALSVDGDAIFAGAPSGLNLSADAGKTWGNPALTEKNVTALLQTPNKTWIAGTAEGELYFQGPEGWTLATSSLTCGSINTFAASADKRLFAGARTGVFVSADDGRAWGPLYPAFPPCDIRALAIGNDGVIWAAARGQGVLRGAERLSTGIANDIRALVLDKDGVLHAGSRFASALLRVDGAPDREICEPEFAKQFEDGQFAGLLFDTGALSEDLRRIFQEQNLPLPDGARLTKLSDTSWRVGNEGPSTYAIFDMGGNQYRVMRETGLEIASQPRSVAGLPEGASRWELLTVDKVLVTLDSLPGQTNGRNADPSADFVCEIARVGTTEPSPDLLTTVVALASPPKNVFDAATLTINANVAPASHGESAVLAEVLGSGDRAIPNQTFTLRKHPVTALQGASPTGEVKYEIDVRVRSSGAFEPMALNGALRPRDVERDSIRWSQVESFENSGPLDAHFIVRENASRQIAIGFGDDVRGRRLPTGAENVIANYRTGAGSAGNFGAGRLTLLKNRPMAVKSVANPIQASGGEDGDALSNIRAVGPIQARALDRIVSWRDFESFARASPGIEKARVDQLTLAGGTVLHFSLARTEDGQIPPGASVVPDFDFEELTRSLRAAMPRNWTLRMSRYRPIWFNITARVALGAGAEPKTTIAAIQAALAAQFGFARRDLARSARGADLITCIQDSPGVKGVFLDSFCLTSSRPGAPAELDARAARVEDGDILPAELLLINPNPVDPRIPARGGLNLSVAT